MVKKYSTMEKIDFVLIWVDDNDPAWQESLRKYSQLESVDARPVRFRDWGTLRYWFRGVEKFAPWVNNIYFITCGHYPDWLNINHPKLKFIKHSDYIPEKYLPTFNSRTIELNLHRIESLSERFVYFNDDTFLINHISPKRFFVNDKVRDIAVLSARQPKGDLRDYLMANNIGFVNRFFDKKEVIKKNKWGWFNPRYGKLLLRTIALYPYPAFTGIYNPHLPNPFFKTTLKKVWNLDYSTLDKTCSCKFRNFQNVNQYVFRYYQLAVGRFMSINPWKTSATYSYMNDDILMEAIDVISNQKKSLICVNDGDVSNFEYSKSILCEAFNKILPDKCSFELSKL